MSDTATFIEECLAGRALATDADDWVDAWHDAPDASTAARMSLSDFLGMTESEYALWVERPEALRFIIAGRKAGEAPATAELLGDLVAAAARAGDDAEAASVVQWLKKTGRL
ncbi:hypothetical protein [Amycolatopsis benzoatilytica]|uniref:hypothetical protein n=1 Tax=Amycolatopsis benzoatilytica TaxID=346045 RepID=UPI0003780EC6|nr:hypothetical protein [Amycolatopsis benzoatilytica]